jgi:putative MATE family efflux protein
MSAIMKDFTQGSITRHMLLMAAPMATGMLVQTLYLIVDLYFVSRLGPDALAAVGVAANAVLVSLAMTQSLSVATVSLVAQAVGHKDQSQAKLVFNQALLAALACMTLTLVIGYLGATHYMRMIASTPAIAQLGTQYLWWYLPGLAMQFLTAALGATLRGTGVVKPIVMVQLITVLLNILLAPVLIAGWGTSMPLGVPGAALASTVSVAAGVILLAWYAARADTVASPQAALLCPDRALLRRMIGIGLPSVGEYLSNFAYTAAVYWFIRDFGADAQAGFGVGARVMQALFMPAMAVTMAIPAVAGQNLGAGLVPRVRDTLNHSLRIQLCIMAALLLLCQASPAALVHFFATDATVVAAAATFIHVISWSLLASGVIFSCSGTLQALGTTLPSLFSSVVRFAVFVTVLKCLSLRPSFAVLDVWSVSVATAFLQAIISWLLVQRQFALQLRQPVARAMPN